MESGSFLAARSRQTISGVIPAHIQTALFIINATRRDLYHDELSVILFQVTEQHSALVKSDNA